MRPFTEQLSTTTTLSSPLSPLLPLSPFYLNVYMNASLSLIAVLSFFFVSCYCCCFYPSCNVSHVLYPHASTVLFVVTAASHCAHHSVKWWSPDTSLSFALTNHILCVSFSSSFLSPLPAPDCTLIDAFVIGARAREHLAKIAKDTVITPRDIAQLSRILGDSTDGSPNKDHVNVASRVTSASAAVTSVLSSSITSASSAPNVHHSSSNNSTNLLPGVNPLQDDSLNTSSHQVHSHHTRNYPPTGHQQSQYVAQLHQQPHQSATGGRLESELLSSIHHHNHSHSHQSHHQILRHQYSGDSVVASSAALSTGIRKVRLSATSSSPAAVVPVSCSSPPPPPPLHSDFSTVPVDGNSNNTATSVRHPSVEQKIFRRAASRPDSTDGAEIEYYELQTTSSIASNALNRTDMNEMPNLYQQTQQFVTTTAPSSAMRQQNVTKIPIGVSSGSGPPGTHYVPSSSSGSSVPTSSSPASSSSQPSSSSGPAVSSSVIVIGATPHQHAPHHHYPYQNTGHQLSSTVSRNVSHMDDVNNDTITSTSHREMPVDVPDSFVGVVKTAPRYPPPASMRSSSLNQTTTSNMSQGMHQIPSSSTTSASSTIVDIERIRKYSEDVKMKRGEDDLLRSSLRDSKKLLKLESVQQQQQTGALSSTHMQSNTSCNVAARINAAYEPDEDEAPCKVSDGTSFISPASLNELESLVSRVSSQVANGDLRNALEKCRISKLLSVYCAVMSSKGQARQLSTLAVSPAAAPSTELVQEIIAMLQEDSSRNPEVAELLEILTRFELEGVCYAFDQIVLAKRQQQQQQRGLVSPSAPPNNTMSSANGAGPGNMTPCGKIDESMIPTAGSTVTGATSAHLTSVCDETGVGVTGVHHPSLGPQSLVSAIRSPASYDPLTEAQLKESQVRADMAYDPYVKVVRIEKSTCDPLGATVRNEPDGSVIIGRIVKGGAAEKCGLLKEGDEILEVNGIEMKGRNVNQVCEILQEMTGMLTFVIAQRSTSAMGIDDAMIAVDGGSIANPLISGGKMSGMITGALGHLGSHVPAQIIHIKAQFDYDPALDLYIPCRELGICFCKGDILHVIDQSDCNWWQAYREGETAGLAGLIPSISFQLQREAMRQSVLTDSSNKSNNNNNNNNTLSTGIHNNNNNNNNNVINSTRALNYKNSSITPDRNGCKKKSSSSSTSSLMLLNCGKRSHEKRKKRRSIVTIGSQEILTYEEVALYYPRANIKRPIVLIGPTSIGRQYLRTRLMKDRERFEAAVPHTSRSIKSDGSEVDGIDYHFITRSLFEQGIREGRFVEHGEFEKNYYGTSLEAIEAVVQSGKICVLNLHVHSINILRSGSTGAKLKPYFVFVSPPPQIEKLNRLINAVALAIDKESNADHRHHTSSSSSLQHHSAASSHGTHSSHHTHSHRQLSPTDRELQAIIDEGREIDARYGHYFDMILNVTDIEKAYNDLLEEINALERDPQWIPIHWLKQ